MMQTNLAAHKLNKEQ
jgi:hypothetical protein